MKKIIPFFSLLLATCSLRINKNGASAEIHDPTDGSPIDTTTAIILIVIFSVALIVLIPITIVLIRKQKIRKLKEDYKYGRITYEVYKRELKKRHVEDEDVD